MPGRLAQENSEGLCAGFPGMTTVNHAGYQTNQGASPREGTASNDKPRVSFQDRCDLRQQLELRELFVSAFVRPLAHQPELVAMLEPRGGLLDRRLLEIVRQGR